MQNEGDARAALGLGKLGISISKEGTSNTLQLLRCEP